MAIDVLCQPTGDGVLHHALQNRLQVADESGNRPQTGAGKEAAMSLSDVLHMPMCTVRRHPDGGFTPVLHASQMEPPQASPSGISLPDVDHAVRYARNHYGVLPVVVDNECRSTTVRDAS